MALKGQLTGMRGVYLVASELSRLGFIASPTSRSAIGADILVTDQSCQRSFSVQVKTNARTFNFWLLSRKTKELVSRSHIYALVNIHSRKDGEEIEYYIVPSRVVADRMKHSKRQSSEWWSIYRSKVEKYQNKWSVFGKP